MQCEWCGSRVICGLYECSVVRSSVRPFFSQSAAAFCTMDSHCLRHHSFSFGDFIFLLWLFNSKEKFVFVHKYEKYVRMYRIFTCCRTEAKQKLNVRPHMLDPWYTYEIIESMLKLILRRTLNEMLTFSVIFAVTAHCYYQSWN